MEGASSTPPLSTHAILTLVKLPPAFWPRRADMDVSESPDSPAGDSSHPDESLTSYLGGNAFTSIGRCVAENRKSSGLLTDDSSRYQAAPPAACNNKQLTATQRDGWFQYVIRCREKQEVTS